MPTQSNPSLTDDVDALKAVAARIRGNLVKMSHEAKTPHLGSSLSCTDIVTTAYWGVLRLDPKKPRDPNRDRFILSKGHAATTLYTTLNMRGFFPDGLLDSYAKNGSALQEHPGPACAPGIEAATGSLGHGLSIGIGMALSGRIQKQDYRVFALLSDGECNEGSVWEAAMFAAKQSLDQICVIVDYNKWQATGRSNDVLSLSPLREKWEAFGWDAHEIDGHDIGALLDIMGKVPNGSGKPLAIIANTVKGKGVSFMEDDNNWHYRIPTAEEVATAHSELGLK
ncbi:MAG: transketolase [Rhodospirillales bacterium]|jgi:transketolase|nr:transketolase [Rhodospirillales bacterium]MBT4006501.1 transketolase [Rhodospirillales bacterium]MBT5075905.1 transketolase [Rhodospirillales bacterium]MBT5113779.1 transketolase [Rhodospirillales bacterium]MBT5672307.1 transketolase [Rhodospirillales bacterium]